MFVRLGERKNASLAIGLSLTSLGITVTLRRLYVAYDSYGFTGMSRCVHGRSLPRGPIVD